MKTFCRLFAAILGCVSFQTQAYDLVHSPYLFGDWGGVRTSLADKGITFNVGYGGESAHNFSGGTKILTEYTDQWVFGFGLDSQKMGLWEGGTFRATMTDRNGENLGADAGIGNTQLIQEVYGRGQTWHLTQFWFNQKFFDDRVEWKAGRMTVGEDFASFSCDFQNLTFCGAQPGNIVGSYWVNWPTSQWATRVKVHSSSETSIAIGAYQVNPNYVSDTYAQQHGWTLDNPVVRSGRYFPWNSLGRPNLVGNQGSYKIGAWYNTAKGTDLSNPLDYSAQYGFYINFEQQLTGTETQKGLSVFLNISQADPHTAMVDRQIALGTQYHGVFDRPNDAVALALGATDSNSRYANYVWQTNPGQVVGDGNEYVGEVYYSFAPITSLFLRPNLQYIVHPGGTSANKDALVGGLKTGVAF